MAAFWQTLAVILVVSACVDAKGKKTKPKASRSFSQASSFASFDWNSVISGLQELLPSADLDVEGLFSKTQNATIEALKGLWESNLQSSIIQPCERWCDDNRGVELTSHELVAKAKSEKCAWNALSGAMSGAIPVPGLDVIGSVSGGFLLQAQGACIVAKQRGYDVQDNKTQSLILWALAGEAGSEMTKKVAQAAAKAGGTSAGKLLVKKVPNGVFKELNKKIWPLIGRHLITKGPQGLLSLTKMVPVVGSVAGAAAGSLIDWYFCHSAIDFADRQVFRMINKEEEELREYLIANGFEDVVEPLMDAQLDTTTICYAEKSDLRDLGLSLGRILQLRRKLSEASGLCAEAHEDL